MWYREIAHWLWLEFLSPVTRREYQRRSLGERQSAHGGGENRFFDINFFMRGVHIGTPGNEKSKEAAGLEEGGIDCVEECVDPISTKR